MPVMKVGPGRALLGGGGNYNDLVIGTGPLAWYQADAITGLVDGNAVVTWLDSSGNGYHVTQAVGAQQPTYRIGIQNGLPAVRFDGGDWLANLAFSDFPDSCSIYVAATHTVTNTVLVEITDVAGGINTGFTLFNEANDERFRVCGPILTDEVAQVITPPVTGLFGGIYAATVRQNIYINGVLEDDIGSTAGALANVLGRIYVGSFTGGAGYQLQGDIFEILIYTAAHNDTQRQQAEAYLNWKWALY